MMHFLPRTRFNDKDKLITLYTTVWIFRLFVFYFQVFVRKVGFTVTCRSRASIFNIQVRGFNHQKGPTDYRHSYNMSSVPASITFDQTLETAVSHFWSGGEHRCAQKGWLCDPNGLIVKRLNGLSIGLVETVL